MSCSTFLVKVLATLRPFSLDRPPTMFFTMDREGQKREGLYNRSPLCGAFDLTRLEPCILRWIVKVGKERAS